MRPDVSRAVREAVAALPREGRERVLRVLRVALADEPVAGVERALGWSRQRLGRAERGGALRDDELAELLVHYGAGREDVLRAGAVVERRTAIELETWDE